MGGQDWEHEPSRRGRSAAPSQRLRRPSRTRCHPPRRRCLFWLCWAAAVLCLPCISQKKHHHLHTLPSCLRPDLWHSMEHTPCHARILGLTFGWSNQLMLSSNSRATRHVPARGMRTLPCCLEHLWGTRPDNLAVERGLCIRIVPATINYDGVLPDCRKSCEEKLSKRGQRCSPRQSRVESTCSQRWRTRGPESVSKDKCLHSASDACKAAWKCARALRMLASARQSDT